MKQLIGVAKGTTHGRVYVCPFHRHAPIVRQFIHDQLKVFDYDQRTHKYNKRYTYAYHNLDGDYVAVPIGFFDQLKESLAALDDVELVERPLTMPTPRELNVKIKEGISPLEHQVAPFKYLISDPSPRRGLSMQTGKGKTATSLMAMCELNVATLIVVSRLMDQWIQEIFKFTAAQSKDVYLIQGSNTLRSLMLQDHKPSIFVASLETMREFYKSYDTNGNDTYGPQEFCQNMGIGLKIMDEVHMSFHTGTMLDLHLNIPHNIYMTATFNQSHGVTKRIFNIVFPQAMRFGAAVYDKYVDAYCYYFHGKTMSKKVMRARGYQHAKYEANLLKHVTKLNHFFGEVLYPRFVGHYINKANQGERCAIFVTTKEMAHKLANWLGEKHPNLKVGTFIQSDGIEQLKACDVIVTTPGKCGTGRDIKQLRTVINTVSTRAVNSIIQMLGRLRDLGEIVPEYVDLTDINIKACVRHAEVRHEVIKQRAATFNKIYLPYY